MEKSNEDLLKELNLHLSQSIITPWRAFRNGVLSGLGAVLGATVVLAILVGLLSTLDTVPIIGEYIKQIVDVVENR